jgi:hypothetical protein
MRINRIMCPACKAWLTSKIGIEAGTSLACPKCKQKFTVAVPETPIVDDIDVVDDENEPKTKKPISREPLDDFDERDEPRKKPVARRRADEDDEEDEQRPTKDRRENVDDADEPRRKRRSRDDDEYEDRPLRNKNRRRSENDDEVGVYGKLKRNIWVRASVLGVLFGILAVLSFLVYVKYKNAGSTDAATASKAPDDLREPINPRNPIDASKQKVKKKEPAKEKVKPESEAFVSAEGRFTALFPGIPKVRIEKSPKGILTKFYGVDDADDGAYIVGFADGEMPKGESAAQTQTRLDAVRDILIRDLGATLTSETKITLDGKYPGRELLATTAKPREGNIRMRFYLVDRRLYEVFVVGKKDWVASPDREKFIDSFALME